MAGSLQKIQKGEKKSSLTVMMMCSVAVPIHQVTRKSRRSHIPPPPLSPYSSSLLDWDACQITPARDVTFALYSMPSITRPASLR